MCKTFGSIVGEESWRLSCSIVIFLNSMHDDTISLHNLLNDLIWEYAHMMKDTYK